MRGIMWFSNQVKYVGVEMKEGRQKEHGTTNL